MKEDKLKEWIKSEREAFESELPSQGLWAGIEQELQASPRNNRKLILAIAASLAVLIALVFWLRDEVPESGMAANQDPVEQAKKDAPRPFLNAEIREAQQFYAGQVQERMSELSKYPVDADLREEMDLLTEEFDLLQSEMGQGLDDSKVVEAMIDNYRLRLDLLEDLLQALDENSKDKNSLKSNEYEL